VAGNLNTILARIAVRSTEDSDEYFVESLSPPLSIRRMRYYPGVVDGIGSDFVAAYRAEGADNREGIRARNTDDTESTARGCGEGADSSHTCSLHDEGRMVMNRGVVHSFKAF